MHLYGFTPCWDGRQGLHWGLECVQVEVKTKTQTIQEGPGCIWETEFMVG